MMKLLTLGLLLGAISFPAMARGQGPDILGDGDPFPVACTDFSGVWSSDQKQNYAIEQKGCEQIQLVKSDGGGNHSMTIVPDNRSRTLQGSDFKGTERHRWNSLRFGAIVETHRKMVFTEKTITEFVTLEEVNDNLILESTYRVIASGETDGLPKYEYNQQVFRRTSATSPGKSR